MISSTRTTRTSRALRTTVAAVAATATLGLTALAGSGVPAQAAPADPAPHVGLDARTATYYVVTDVPKGSVVGRFRGYQSADELFVTYRWNRGDGGVEVGVNIQSDFLTPADAAAFYADYCGSDTYVSCDLKTDTDGSYLVRATQKLPRGGVAVIADHYAADGTRVVARTGNTADSKYGGPVRARGIGIKTATLIAQDPRLEIDQRIPAADIEAAKKVVRPWTLVTS